MMSSGFMQHQHRPMCIIVICQLRFWIMSREATITCLLSNMCTWRLFLMSRHHIFPFRFRYYLKLVLPSLLSNTSHSWLILNILSQEKSSNTVIPWGLFVLKQINILASIVLFYYIFNTCLIVIHNDTSFITSPWILASSDSLNDHCVSLMITTNARSS